MDKVSLIDRITFEDQNICQQKEIATEFEV